MIRCAALACALLALLAWPRPAAADDTLTVIGITASSLFEVVDDVAEHAGFFKAEHLNVVIQYAGNPAVAIQALATGKGDVASGNINGIVLGYEKGVRMVCFFARTTHLQGVLGVLDSGPIHSLADFKGKTIGETSLGQPGEIFTRALLAGAGLKPSDYSFVGVGLGPTAVAAITQDKIQALTQPYPALRIYEVTAGVKFRYFFQPILNDVPDDDYFATPATIANKADALRRFSRAYVKASIFVHENPQVAARWFVADSGDKVTDQSVADEVRVLALTQELFPGNNPANKRIGEIPLRGMRIYNKFMYDNGLTSQIVPADAMVTDQFIDFANNFDRQALITQAKATH